MVDARLELPRDALLAGILLAAFGLTHDAAGAAFLWGGVGLIVGLVGALATLFVEGGPARGPETANNR